MKNSKLNYSAFLLFLFLVGILLLEGCENNQSVNANSNVKRQPSNSETEKTSLPNDNVEELLELVQLPELPKEVVWREGILGAANGRVPGPTDKKLVAVLQYTPETSSKLLSIIEKNQPPEQVEIDAENWFPEELTAKAQLSGNGMIKGTAFGANQFYNIPYGSGRIVRVEGTDYFILELATQ